jgi:hypothetical protein
MGNNIHHVEELQATSLTLWFSTTIMNQICAGMKKLDNKQISKP